MAGGPLVMFSQNFEQRLLPSKQKYPLRSYLCLLRTIG